MIKIHYRPVIAVNDRQRALKDRDDEETAENALMKALEGEKPGAEGYILTVFKKEEEPQ